jgi:hypothetical protein
MKKLILSVVIALSGIVSTNAQIYVSGALGYSSSDIKTEEGDKYNAPSFSISPAVGYRFNDKLEIGLSVFAVSSTSISTMTFSENTIFIKTKTQNFVVGPYLRYSVFKFQRFSLLGSATIYAGKGKTETGPENNILGITISNIKIDQTNWGASIYPTLRYDLSNKIAIFSNLTLLQLGYSQTKIKDGHTTNNFDFIANATDIVPAIGVMYKF